MHTYSVPTRYGTCTLTGVSVAIGAHDRESGNEAGTCPSAGIRGHVHTIVPRDTPSAVSYVDYCIFLCAHPP